MYYFSICNVFASSDFSLKSPYSSTIQKIYLKLIKSLYKVAQKTCYKLEISSDSIHEWSLFTQMPLFITKMRPLDAIQLWNQ